MKRLLLLLLMSTLSCSHGEQRTFHDLDGDDKAVFIAYYSMLTPDQRAEMLESLEPIRLLREWKVANVFFRNPDTDHPEFVARPENYTISRIDIDVDRSDPGARASQGLPLRAMAHYLDGRNVDITGDTEWKVLPEIAYMEGHTLHFDCLGSDVEVNARFMNHYSGSRRIEVRKEIRSLELAVAGKSVAVGPQEFIHLEAIAHCSDGSSSKVTCQTEWKNKGNARITGCGVLQLLPIRSPNDNYPIPVTASYGGVTVTKSFEFTPVLLFH